jgi:hypothetical protein
VSTFTLLILAVSVSILGLAPILGFAIQSHLRTVKEKNSEYHRGLLKETEERLLRFQPAPQA